MLQAKKKIAALFPTLYSPFWISSNHNSQYVTDVGLLHLLSYIRKLYSTNEKSK